MLIRASHGYCTSLTGDGNGRSAPSRWDRSVARKSSCGTFCKAFTHPQQLRRQQRFMLHQRNGMCAASSAAGELGSLGSSGGDPSSISISSGSAGELEPMLPTTGGGQQQQQQRSLGWRERTTRLREQLASYGVAGVVAYGLLNTAYYTVAFLFFWLCVAKVQPGMGLSATMRKFAEVFALTWAGSQVTKIPRAAGAIVIAPFIDRALEALQRKLGLQHKNQAAGIVVGTCLLMALALFGVVVVGWS